MAQSRPSTFVLWQVLIDLFDVMQRSQGVQFTSEALAEALKTKYNSLQEDERRKHLALRTEAKTPDAETFPSKSTVQRYITWIEEDFRPFHGSRSLIPTNGKNAQRRYTSPTRENIKDIQKIVSIGRGTRLLLGDGTDGKRSLHLSVSDSVGHFFVPRVLDGVGKQFPAIKQTQFQAIQTEYELESHAIDLAIAWNAYGSTVRSPNIQMRTLANSESSIHLVFNPKHTQLAQHKKEYLLQNGENDPKGRDFCLKPDDLKKEFDLTLCHPASLIQLKQIAEQLHSHLAVSSLHQVETFPSVISMVASGVGVGLFFGIEWVLDELESRHRIMTARLELPPDWNLDTKLWLNAYTRREDESETSTNVEQLIKGMERLLANAGHPGPETPTDWHICGPALAEKWNAKFSEGKYWFIYFVTSGRVASAPFPQWLSGTIEFGIAGTNGPEGMLNLKTTHGENFMKVWILADPASDGCLILRFQRTTTGRLDKNTIAYLPCRVTRKGISLNEMILLGTLNFAVTHSARINSLSSGRWSVPMCHRGQWK